MGSVGVRLGVALVCVGVCRWSLLWCDDVNLSAGEAAAHDFARFKMRPYVEGFGDGGEFFERDAGVDEGAEEHVAADAGEAVKICNTHRLVILNWRGVGRSGGEAI